MSLVAPENAEAREAWNGVLFDRFVAYRHLIVAGIAPHGDAAIRLEPAAPGDRVLDVGCGFGDSTRQLASLVGPAGCALGVDVAERFIAAAIAEAAAERVANVRFETADVEVTRFAGTYDYAFSRFGTMFCANPVAALRNVRQALRPGGRFVCVVWRRKLDNPWLHVAEGVVTPLVDEDEETDEARCGPGPFSQANADTLSGQLLSAGFSGDHTAAERPADHDRPRPRRGGRVQPRDRAGGRGRSPRGCRRRRDQAAARGAFSRGTRALRDPGRARRKLLDLDRERARPAGLSRPDEPANPSSRTGCTRPVPTPRSLLTR